MTGPTVTDGTTFAPSGLLMDRDELTLIGGILGLKAETAASVLASLDWVDFNSPVLGAVFELIKNVVQHGNAPAPWAVLAEARNAPGGRGYGTHDLVDAVITARLAALRVDLAALHALRDLVRLRSVRPAAGEAQS